MGSVGGLLVLLKEPSLRLQSLNALYNLTTDHWSELLNQLEMFSELANTSEDEQERNLACSICAKCFYYLEDYSSALQYSLKSGVLLSKGDSEFEFKMVAKALETFILLNKLQNEDVEVDESLEIFQDKDMKSKLNVVIDDLFKSCVQKGSFKEALGIAFEAQSVDKISFVLENVQKESLSNLCTYSLDLILSSSSSFPSQFKSEVINCLADFFEQNPSSNIFSLFAALYSLKDSVRFSTLLKKLFHGDDRNTSLLALQVVFDLLRVSEDPNFVNQIRKELGDERSILTEILDKKVTQKIENYFLMSKNDSDPLLFKQIKDRCGTNSVMRNAALSCYGFLQSGTGVNSFLTRQEGKNFLKPSTNWSRFSAAAVYGSIYQGTGEIEKVKDFLPNIVALPIDSRAGPYSEGGGLFALGLINSQSLDSKSVGFLNSSLEKSMEMRTLNPPSADGMSGFEVKKWEPLIQGACLGIGLVLLASGKDMMTMDVNNTSLFEEEEEKEEEASVSVTATLLKVFALDEAVASESAAWSLGAIYMGSFGKSEVVGELTNKKSLLAKIWNTAQVTSHERISRASSLCIALTLYKTGRSELDLKSSAMIELLASSQDAVVRYGGMFAFGLSFVATSDGPSIKRLLKVAVSDVSNDVRRAAVMNLGLICLNEPSKVPELIALLAESYNSHVRYGAAIALGIAGTNLSQEKNPKEFGLLFHTLWKLLEDKVDYVKQGALIGLGMALSQSNHDIKDSYSHKFFSKAMEFANNIKISSMTRLGAVLGIGILESGGRNSPLCFLDSNFSGSQVLRTEAVFGLVMFLQYWYWYPLEHMLTLAMSPTSRSLIGLRVTEDWRLYLDGKFSVACDVDNKKLKEFAYCDKIKGKKTEQRLKIETAVLSMSSNNNAPLLKKKKEDENNKMDIEEEKKKAEEIGEDKREEMLKNPLRVTKEQEEYLTFKNMEDGSALPVALDDFHKTGIVILTGRERQVEDGEKVFVDMTTKSEGEKKD